jgi:hypothetical protein
MVRQGRKVLAESAYPSHPVKIRVPIYPSLDLHPWLIAVPRLARMDGFASETHPAFRPVKDSKPLF